MLPSQRRSVAKSSPPSNYPNLSSSERWYTKIRTSCCVCVGKKREKKIRLSWMPFSWWFSLNIRAAFCSWCCGELGCGSGCAGLDVGAWGARGWEAWGDRDKFPVLCCLCRARTPPGGEQNRRCVGRPSPARASSGRALRLSHPALLLCSPLCSVTFLMNIGQEHLSWSWFFMPLFLSPAASTLSCVKDKTRFSRFFLFHF